MLELNSNMLRSALEAHKEEVACLAVILIRDIALDVTDRMSEYEL